MCTFNVFSKFNTIAAVGCTTMGVILLMIAIFPLEWSRAKKAKTFKGLWGYSYDTFNFEYSESEISPALHLTRALSTIAVVTSWAALLLCSIHTIETVLFFTISRRVHLGFGLLVFHTAMGSWVCSILAMLVWGFAVHDMNTYEFGSGFVICLMGAFLVLMGGLEAYNATITQHPRPRVLS
ncbi:hypothetical protein ElyMa_001433900, partial [Elysia marginata]